MSKKNKKRQPKFMPMDLLYDPLGSYTGNYLLQKLEEPVQDVDDL